MAQEISYILLNSETPDEIFESISKLIILIICTPQKKLDNSTLLENKQRLIQEIHYEFQSILNMDNSKRIKPYFKRLEKVSEHIKNRDNLGSQQKLEYCGIERLLMRLYLKNINARCNQD